MVESIADFDTAAVEVLDVGLHCFDQIFHLVLYFVVEFVVGIEPGVDSTVDFDILVKDWVDLLLC